MASQGLGSHHQEKLSQVDEDKLARMYPDFTKEDDAEVHPSMQQTYDDLLRIREDLLCIYRDSKRGAKHDEKLKAVRVRLDNIENQAKGGDRKYNWSGYVALHMHMNLPLLCFMMTSRIFTNH
jgi:hypothetical protein